MKGGNLFGRNWLRVKAGATAWAVAEWAADFDARVTIAGIKEKKWGRCCPFIVFFRLRINKSIVQYRHRKYANALDSRQALIGCQH